MIYFHSHRFQRQWSHFLDNGTIVVKQHKFLKETTTIEINKNKNKTKVYAKTETTFFYHPIKSVHTGKKPMKRVTSTLITRQIVY